MRAIRPVAYVVAAVVLLILGAEVQSCRQDRKEKGQPIRVEPTKRIQEWDIVRISADLRIPDPPQKALPKVRKDYARPDLVAPSDAIRDGEVVAPTLLAEGVIPCEEGVREVQVGAILEPGGSVSLAAKPQLRKFLGAPLRWQVGGHVDWLLNPRAGDPRIDGEVWAGIHALRIGRIQVAPRIAVGQKFGETYGVARLAVWRDF